MVVASSTTDGSTSSGRVSIVGIAAVPADVGPGPGAGLQAAATATITAPMIIARRRRIRIDPFAWRLWAGPVSVANRRSAGWADPMIGGVPDRAVAL